MQESRISAMGPSEGEGSSVKGNSRQICMTTKIAAGTQPFWGGQEAQEMQTDAMAT